MATGRGERVWSREWTACGLARAERGTTTPWGGKAPVLPRSAVLEDCLFRGPGGQGKAAAYFELIDAHGTIMRIPCRGSTCQSEICLFSKYISGRAVSSIFLRCRLTPLRMTVWSRVHKLRLSSVCPSCPRIRSCLRRRANRARLVIALEN